MKMNLFVKQTIKENYKYLLTVLLTYIFLAVLYHITAVEEIQIYGIQLACYVLTIAHSLILPSILFKNYYQQTNVNHLASIPFKRSQVFIGLYIAGMMLSVMMIVGYGALTTLVSSSGLMFIDYTGGVLMGFMYYYHLSLFAMVVCGNYLFQCVVQIILIFGPIIAYLIYQWALEMYVSTYLVSTQLSSILYLIPGIGCASYFIEVDPSIYYALYIKEIIVFIVLALIGNRYRPNEKVGQGMVFHIFSYVVRTIATLLGSAALFAVFGSILGERDYISQIIVATILSMLVCYFVESIYKKRTKVFYSIKYGVLVALVIFGSIYFGTKKIENYTPTNYDYFVVNITDYNTGRNSEIKIEDEKLIYDVEMLNRDLLNYYKVHYKDVQTNRLYGHMSVRFYHDQLNNYFSRQYSYTTQMKEMVLDKEMYRDLLYYIFTKNENDLLNRAKEKKEIVIELEDKTFVINKEHEFYLFENYLSQGLKELYESPLPILDALEGIDLYMSGHDDEGYYVSYNSSIIYDALSKTFGF